MGRFNWVILALATLVILLTLVAYWPGMQAGFYLDDDPNIVYAPALHWTELTAEGLYNVAKHALLPTRFVANISFAINHYFSGLTTAPYHWTNLVIHLGVGSILFWVILLLQHREQTPLNDWTVISAILAVGLFLLHPLTVQAVTYTVQRMTLLAALFSLLAFAIYLLAQKAPPGMKRVWLWAASFLCWTLAVFSKEIALALPLIIAIYEASFNITAWRHYIKALSYKFGNHVVWGVILASAIAAGTIILWLYAPALSWYENLPNRDFNGYQRVLTELRVQFFYLALLFWPSSHRLNLEHDFILSTGLLVPWSTALALIGIMMMVVCGIWLAKYKPRYGFPVLAYLAWHLIESGPLDLELVFEHRMYMPMTMLAVMIANLSIDYVKWRKAILIVLLIMFIPLSISTHQRNLIWGDSDPLRLLYDCAEKSPNKFRAQFNLGTELGKRGRLLEAERVLSYAKSLRSENSDVYNQLGNIYLLLRRRQDALWHYQQAVTKNPSNAEAQYNLAMMYESIGKIREAADHYQKFVDLSIDIFWLRQTREAVIDKLKSSNAS